MGMVLRLTDQETERLRRQAEREHRSMQQIARVALTKYLDEHDDDAQTLALAHEEVARWSEALRRLGE
jgi:predicted transcriptional regulator